MESDARPLVIAGGGAAGRTAARTLQNAQVKRPIVHLTGLSTEAIDRTMVDKAIMTGRLSPARAVAMRPPLEGVCTREDRLAAVAEVADTPFLRLTLSSGESLEAAGLIVATGSTPYQLDVPGVEAWRAAGRLTTLHSVDDALRIRELLEGVDGARVLVSGAGLVGAEAASLLKEAGCLVTLVARSPLPGVPVWGSQIAQQLVRIHDEAVVTHWGARIIELTDGLVRLDTGVAVEADLVVVAHGAHPHVPLGVPAVSAVSDGEGRVEVGTEGRARGRTGDRIEGRLGDRTGGRLGDRTGGVPVDDRLRVLGTNAPVMAAGAVALHGTVIQHGAVAQQGTAIQHGAVAQQSVADSDASSTLRPYRVDHWDDAEAQGAHAAHALLHALGYAQDPGPYRAKSPWSARIHGHQLAGFGHPLPGAVERVVSNEPLLVEVVHPGPTASSAQPGTTSSTQPGTTSSTQPGTASSTHPGAISPAQPGPTASPAHPDTGWQVSAVVGLGAGRALRDHARATVLSELPTRGVG